jgi:pimeloyl-ACP methyl ester carboxylesterase
MKRRARFFPLLTRNSNSNSKEHPPLPAFTDRLALMPLALQGYRRRWVDTSVGAVHVLGADGKGALPPLVLLHGFSSAGAHFFPMLHRLRPHVERLILPDSPAHGFSATPEHITAATLKQGLVEALDAVVDRPSVIFGNSMGGIGAIHYARLRPERVAGLILCSPTGAAMTVEELTRFLRTFDVNNQKDALAFLDRVLSRRSWLRHLVAWELARKFRRPELRALLASTRPTDFFAPGELAALAPPGMLIWGQDDRIMPAEHLAYFRAHLPRQTRVLTPAGFGHSPYLDAPGALAEMILGFARDVTPRGRRARGRQGESAQWG